VQERFDERSTSLGSLRLKQEEIRVLYRSGSLVCGGISLSINLLLLTGLKQFYQFIKMFRVLYENQEMAGIRLGL
jgi:hypothetical protein